MADKLNPKIVSLSLVGVVVIISILCALSITIAPEVSLKFFGSIFHGIDMTQIVSPITLSGVLTGLAALVIVAFATGWLFAAIYNYLLDKII